MPSGKRDSIEEVMAARRKMEGRVDAIRHAQRTNERSRRGNWPEPQLLPRDAGPEVSKPHPRIERGRVAHLGAQAVEHDEKMAEMSSRPRQKVKKTLSEITREINDQRKRGEERAKVTHRIEMRHNRENRKSQSEVLREVNAQRKLEAERDAALARRKGRPQIPGRQTSTRHVCGPGCQHQAPVVAPRRRSGPEVSKPHPRLGYGPAHLGSGRASPRSKSSTPRHRRSVSAHSSVIIAAKNAQISALQAQLAAAQKGSA